MRIRIARLALGGTAAMALVAMTAGAVLAQPGSWWGWNMGPGMMGQGPMGPGMMGWGYGQQGQGYGMRGYGRMGIVDLNDDGRVSAEEAAAAADEVYAAMDADDDGKITKDEYMAVRMGPGSGWNAERQAAMQAQKEARYAEMDADKDGTVTRAEFLDAAKAHHEAADTDKDGSVSPWEHRRRGWF